MPPKKEPSTEEVLKVLGLPSAEVQRLFDAVRGREPLRVRLAAANKENRRLKRPTMALVDSIKKRQAFFLSSATPKVVQVLFRRIQTSAEELRRSVLGDDRTGGFPGDLAVGAYAEALVSWNLPPTVGDLESLLFHFADSVGAEKCLPTMWEAVLCAQFAPDRFEARIKKGQLNTEDIRKIDGKVRSLLSKRRAELEREPRGAGRERKRAARSLLAPDVRGVAERTSKLNLPLVPALSDEEFAARAGAAAGTMRSDAQGRDENLAFSKELGRSRGDDGLSEALRRGSTTLRRKVQIPTPLRNVTRPKK